MPGSERVEAAAHLVHASAAAGLALVLTLHAGAALKHQFLDRDDVLARMLWRP